MGRLTAAALAEANSPNSSTTFGMSAAWPIPFGTKYYGKEEVSFSDGAAPRRFVGGKVLKWGQIRISKADRGNSIQGLTFNPVISDDDYAFLNARARGLRLENTAVKVYMGSPLLTAADTLTLFSGIFYDFSFPAVGQVQVNCRQNDLMLDAPFPRYPLGPVDFQFIDKTAVGLYPNIIYGRQDDAGSINHGFNQGAVPCPYVDNTSTNSFKYCVALGRVNVQRVYSAGILKTSGYSISFSTINGRLYTLVIFTSSQGTNAVTCDVEGYESVGDGTGTLVIEATDVLAHIMTNFSLLEYQGGTWATTTSLLDATYLAAAKAFLKWRPAGSSYAAPVVFSKQITGRAILNSWLSAMEMKAFWTGAGTIAIRPDNPCVQNGQNKTWFDAPSWLNVALETQPILTGATAQSQAGRIQVSYQNNYTVPATKLWSIEVGDPLSIVGQPDTVSLDFGPCSGP